MLNICRHVFKATLTGGATIWELASVKIDFDTTVFDEY